MIMVALTCSLCPQNTHVYEQILLPLSVERSYTPQGSKTGNVSNLLGKKLFDVVWSHDNFGDFFFYSVKK